MSAARVVPVPPDLAQECRDLMAHFDGRGAPLQDWPAAQGLIEAAIAALEASIPASFEHNGRTYVLSAFLTRFELAVRADVLSNPLVRLRTESLRWCGFRACH